MIRVPFFSFHEEIALFRDSWHLAFDRVLESGCFVLGEEGRLFELEFATFLGAPGGVVGVANGTEAIALGLRALGVRPGDRVVAPSFTAVPTISAIRQIGAQPVFCEVNLTGLLDPERLEVCLEPRVKAVVAVHLYGNIADIPAIREICAPRSIPILEDCAQAHGGSLHGRMAGTLGDVAAFSFYPTKNLGALGDGGCCFSSSQEITDSLRRLRIYGFEKLSDYYALEDGVNSRLDEVQAAFLRVKLQHLEDNLARRRHLATIYDRELAAANVSPLAGGEGVFHAYHLYVIRSNNRDRLREALAQEGIDTKIHYPTPVHQMPAFARYYKPGRKLLSQTDLLSSQVLSLPLHPFLSDDTILHISDVIRHLA